MYSILAEFRQHTYSRDTPDDVCFIFESLIFDKLSRLDIFLITIVRYLIKFFNIILHYMTVVGWDITRLWIICWKWCDADAGMPNGIPARYLCIQAAEVDGPASIFSLHHLFSPQSSLSIKLKDMKTPKGESCAEIRVNNGWLSIQVIRGWEDAASPVAFHQVVIMKTQDETHYFHRRTAPLRHIIYSYNL